MKIFRCKHCGNIITKLEDRGVGVYCCGEEMIELIANTEDAAVEKHVPIVEIINNEINVKIGEIEHPMIKEHYIEFIILVTNNGHQIKFLEPGNNPEAKFIINNEIIKEVYEYCNLHGLWKKEIN